MLRAVFKTPERSSGAGNYYPFFLMKDGEQARVRFLPDKNEENPMGFLVEKVQHNLEINGERKTTPCLSMYDEDCPICAVSQQYYKSGDEANGKKYWKKRQHVAQVIVIEDPLPADATTGETHEGKVRFITIGFQLFNIIKAAFESGDLDEVPFAFDGGYDFVIKKTAQGQYSSYALGSNFVRKATTLDEDTIAMVEDSIVDLATLLPANPGTDKINAMLNAALTGGDVEEEKSSSDSLADAMKKMKTTETKTEAAVEPEKVVEEAEAEDDLDEDDILARVRNRRQQKLNS